MLRSRTGSRRPRSRCGAERRAASGRAGRGRGRTTTAAAERGATEACACACAVRPPEGGVPPGKGHYACAVPQAWQGKLSPGVGCPGFVTCRLYRLESLETVLLAQGLRIIDFLFFPPSLISFVKREKWAPSQFSEAQSPMLQWQPQAFLPGVRKGWLVHISDRCTHCISFRNSSHWQNDPHTPPPPLFNAVLILYLSSHHSVLAIGHLSQGPRSGEQLIVLRIPPLLAYSLPCLKPQLVEASVDTAILVALETYRQRLLIFLFDN